jgi:acyl-coenzyme A thioesterase PaaI-like protein
MRVDTHKEIDESLSGRVVESAEGFARVVLHTHRAMSADGKGLIHGGFIFSAADYCAMAAVNDPNVVLGAASVRFIAPVRRGESLTFTARVVEEKGKKRVVEVEGSREGERVFEGSFDTFVLPTHILER